MDTTIQKRIDKAWLASKGWITSFEGAPDLALLVNVPVASVLPGLARLSEESQDFRLSAIPTDHPDASEFIPLEGVPAALAQLQANRIAELSANYVQRSPAFDLDLHLVIHPVNPEAAALELVWWSDQVFSVEEDNPAQFAALMAYFIHLQALFGSPQLFIGPEAGLDPKAGEGAWVEV